MSNQIPMSREEFKRFRENYGKEKGMSGLNWVDFIRKKKGEMQKRKNDRKK